MQDYDHRYDYDRLVEELYFEKFDLMARLEKCKIKRNLIFETEEVLEYFCKTFQK